MSRASAYIAQQLHFSPEVVKQLDWKTTVGAFQLKYSILVHEQPSSVFLFKTRNLEYRPISSSPSAKSEDELVVD